jgi:hypothetical protein
VHWVHGGTTDLDNLILLCFRHHWMVHEGKWQLVRSDGGRMLAIPPTVRFGRPARDGTDSTPEPPPERFDDEGVDTTVEVQDDAGYDSSS